MATIRKRNNSYQIRVSAGYDITGNQIIKTMTWTPEPNMTQKQIDKELQRQVVLFEEDVKNGLVGDNQIRLSDYCRYVIDLKARTGLKRSTIERYKAMLPDIDTQIGHLKLCSIKPKHLNDFYNYLSKDRINKRTGGKLESKTILEYHRFISTTLTQAEKELIVPFNIAHKATPPKVIRKEANYLQPEDARKVLAALDNAPLKYKVLTLLISVIGCRRGEELGIKWKNIDLSDMSITLSNNVLYSPEIGVYETTTKTNKNRGTKIPDEVMQYLIQYKQEYIQLKLANGDMWKGYNSTAAVGSDEWLSEDYVFVQSNGKAMHPDTPTNWMNKFSKKNNLPHMTPKVFRHTVASILISEGVDIVTVSKQLGHAKVSTTTDIYSHLIEKASEKVAETMGNMLFNKNVN